jgi:hypothetical protein
MQPTRGIQGIGSWEQEGLWVMRSIDELHQEQRRQGEAAAVTIRGDLAKAKTDLDALHNKIRDLEAIRVTLVIRNWLQTGGLAIALVVMIELLRFVLKSR